MTDRRRCCSSARAVVSTATHIKGFDQKFPTVTFHTGQDAFEASLEGSRFDLTVMPAHRAAADFPLTAEGLAEWDAIVFSDIGSQHAAAPPGCLAARQAGGEPAEAGAGLRHGWRRLHDGRRVLQLPGHQRRRALPAGTAIEEVLPVTIHPVDGPDRDPGRLSPPTSRPPGDPILDGLTGAPWPLLLVSTRWWQSPARGSSPACRPTRAATPCWSPAPQDRGGRSPGPPTWVRTGARSRSATGKATAGSGSSAWTG